MIFKYERVDFFCRSCKVYGRRHFLFGHAFNGGGSREYESWQKGQPVCTFSDKMSRRTGFDAESERRDKWSLLGKLLEVM